MDLLIFILLICIFCYILYLIINKHSESYMNLNSLEHFETTLSNSNSDSNYDYENLYNPPEDTSDSSPPEDTSEYNSNSKTEDTSDSSSQEPIIANFDLHDVILNVEDLIKRGMHSDVTHTFKWNLKLLHKDDFK